MKAVLVPALCGLALLGASPVQQQPGGDDVVIEATRLPKPGVWRFHLGAFRELVSGNLNRGAYSPGGQDHSPLPEGLEPNGTEGRLSETRTCLSQEELEADPRHAIAYAIAPCRWLRFKMAGGRIDGMIMCSPRIEQASAKVILRGRYDGESMRTHFQVTSDSGDKETVVEFTQLASRASDCGS